MPFSLATFWSELVEVAEEVSDRFANPVVEAANLEDRGQSVPMARRTNSLRHPVSDPFSSHPG